MATSELLLPSSVIRNLTLVFHLDTKETECATLKPCMDTKLPHDLHQQIQRSCLDQMLSCAWLNTFGDRILIASVVPSKPALSGRPAHSELFDVWRVVGISRQLEFADARADVFPLDLWHCFWASRRSFSCFAAPRREQNDLIWLRSNHGPSCVMMEGFQIRGPYHGPMVLSLEYGTLLFGV